MLEKERLIEEIAIVYQTIKKTLVKGSTCSQDHLLANLNQYLSQVREKLSYGEEKGLCHGLSLYYLYMRITGRKELYWQNIDKIWHYQAEQALEDATDIAFQKTLNHTRWLHSAQIAFHALSKQSAPHESLSFILKKNKPAHTEYSFSFCANKEEFIDFCENVIPNERIVILHNVYHAMGLYKSNNSYYFYDVDFNCLAEIPLSNARDLYYCLLLQMAGYNLEMLRGFNFRLFDLNTCSIGNEIINVIFDPKKMGSFDYTFAANENIYRGNFDLNRLEGFVAQYPLTIEQLVPFKQQILAMLPKFQNSYSHIPNYIPLSFTILRLHTQKTVTYPTPQHLFEKYQQKDPEFFERCGFKNRTILHLNSYSCDGPTYQYLLQQKQLKTKINQPEYLNYLTPLMFCAQEENLGAISSLIQAGAQVNYVNPRNLSALAIVVRINAIGTIQHLISHGADIYVNGIGKEDNWSPLFYAAAAALETFQLLYSHHKKKGGNLDFTENGESLLSAIISHDNLPVAEFLLHERAYDGTAGRKQQSVSWYGILNIAAEKSSLAMVQLLIKNGIAPTAIPPLFLSAVKGEKLETIQYLESLSNISPILYAQAALEAMIANKTVLTRYLIDKIAFCSGADLIKMIEKHNVPQAYTLLKELLTKKKLNLNAYDSQSNQSLFSWAKENEKAPPLADAGECISMIQAKSREPHYANLLQVIAKANCLSQQLTTESKALEKHRGLIFFGSYFNRMIDLKNQKASNLMQMIETFSANPNKPIKELVQQIEKKQPAFTSGFFSHRVRDLVTEMENMQLKNSLGSSAS